MGEELKNLEDLIKKTKEEIAQCEQFILDPDSKLEFFDFFSDSDQERFDELTELFDKYDQKFTKKVGDPATAPRSFYIPKYFEKKNNEIQKKKKIYNDLVNYKKNYSTNLLNTLNSVKESIDSYNVWHRNEPKRLRRFRLKGEFHISRKPIPAFVNLFNNYLEQYRKKRRREQRKCRKLKAEIDEIKNDFNQIRFPKGKLRRTKPKVIYEENRPTLLFGVQFLSTIPKLGDCFVIVNNFYSKMSLLITGQMTALIKCIDDIIKEKKLFRKRRIKKIIAPRERYLHCTDDITKRAHKMVERFVRKKPMNQRIRKYNRKNRPANIKRLIEYIATIRAIPKSPELKNGHFH